MRRLRPIGAGLTAAVTLLLAPVGAGADASGIPFVVVQSGLAQPPHTSPIQYQQAFQGAGLDGPRPPGLGFAPVAPFLPRLRQHRDSVAPAIQTLARFDRPPGDLQPRSDHVWPSPGGLAGALLPPRPALISAGVHGAGAAWELTGSARIRSSQGYVRGVARATGADGGYHDGNGRQVPYGYRRNTQMVLAGGTPSPMVEVFGQVVRDELADARTPSAPTDSLWTNRTVGRVGIEVRGGAGRLSRVRAEARYRAAERRNDNHSLRDFSPGQGGRRVEADAARSFRDVSAFADVHTGSVEHRVGINLVHERRDAHRRADPDPLSATPVLTLNTGRLFPDLTVLEVGGSWQAAASVSSDDHLRLGLGVRRLSAEADGADTRGDGPFALLSPGVPGTGRALWETYWGPVDTSPDATLVDGRMLYTREALGDRLILTVDLARLQRAPDTKELFWAGIAPVPAAVSRLVGNPTLRPETHHQGGAGLSFSADDWGVAVAGQVSVVRDFISRDRARGQAGVRQADGAVIFRNVDVRMWTVELDATWNLPGGWAVAGTIVATQAENISDGRPLYGIAPWEANLLLEYRDRLARRVDWAIGAKLRHVTEQDRVDADPAIGSGFDAGATAPFTVVDLYADMAVGDWAALRLGADNLFDAAYEEHVAPASIDAPQRTRVPAPGRSVYLRVAIAF